MTNHIKPNTINQKNKIHLQLIQYLKENLHL